MSIPLTGRSCTNAYGIWKRKKRDKKGANKKIVKNFFRFRGKSVTLQLNYAAEAGKRATSWLRLAVKTRYYNQNKKCT